MKTIAQGFWECEVDRGLYVALQSLELTHLSSLKVDAHRVSAPRFPSPDPGNYRSTLGLREFDDFRFLP